MSFIKISRISFVALIGLSLVVAASAQPLPAPEHLQVVSSDGTFKGSWDAVNGASYYEVWTKLYGNWHFSEREQELMPFTSSFEYAGKDERTMFRVRAVSSKGVKGEFSKAVHSTPAAPVAASSGSYSPPGSSSTTAKASDFDPDAPPPDAPDGLFAVWVDPRTVRLIWRASAKATRYAVEEFKDEKWSSIVGLEVIKSPGVVIKDRPMPGPYKFRIRAIGSNGRSSSPSRTTTLQR